METEESPQEADIVAALLPEVEKFLAREVDGYALDREGVIPVSLQKGLAALGLFGLTVPESYGGAGLSLGAAGRVVAEVARVDRSTAIMLGLHAGLGTRGLVEHGGAALRERWLPRLASGQCIAAFAATEAEAGSDLTAIRTTGKLIGDCLHIDGEKSYVTNGGFAGLFTVLIRTPGLGGERAHSLVCVPADAPGVRVGREEDKLGIRGSSTVTVSFENVEVSRDHILGKPGSGMDLAHGLLTWGRTLMSAGCVGTARAALDASLGHVTTRRQFGGTIARFAATRAHIAWMSARVLAMEVFVASVAAAHARGDSIEVDSAMLKVFCSEGAFETCDRAVQLHGALGFLEPTGVARMLRDCRITRIFEGANDVLLVRVGAQLLAEPRGNAERAASLPIVTTGDHLSAADSQTWLAPGFGGCEDVERAVQGEARALRERFGVGAVRRQIALQRLAQAAICARAARAVLSDQAEDAALSPGTVRFHRGQLGNYAAATLLSDARLWLQRLVDADHDDLAAQAVAEQVFAQGFPG